MRKGISEALAQSTASQGEGFSSQMNQDIEGLKQDQREFFLEKKVQSLSTPGAKSQYRAMATIGLKIESALVKLDEITASLPVSEGILRDSLSSLRKDLSSAEDISEERCALIVKADDDPANGWQALTRYEKLLEVGKGGNPDQEKLFSECLRKVEEEGKGKSKAARYRFTSSVDSTDSSDFSFPQGHHLFYFSFLVATKRLYTLGYVSFSVSLLV